MTAADGLSGPDMTALRRVWLPTGIFGMAAVVVLSRVGLINEITPLTLVVPSFFLTLLLGPVTRRPRANRILDAIIRPASRDKSSITLMLNIALILYVSGWGPAMVPGLLVGIALLIGVYGSGACKPAFAGAVIGTTLGQVAYAMGWVPTELSSAAIHGMGLLGIVIVTCMAYVLGKTTAQLEQTADDRARAEARLDALVHNSSDMVTVVDHDGRIIFQTSSVARVLGHGTDLLVGRRLSSFAHPDDTDTLKELCDIRRSSVDVRLRHHDGRWVWCEARSTDMRHIAGVEGVLLNIRDSSGRKRLEEELRHQAYHDGLTGLTNRERFWECLRVALAEREEDERPMAVALIDLDDFKAVNDSLGHGAGDRLLVELARRLTECVRDSDTVARLGGDEFAVLIRAGHTDELTQVTQRLLAVFQQRVDIGGHGFPMSASIGLAVASAHTESPEDLMRNADVAMYVAKNRGKGRAVQFSPEMHMAVHERLQLKADLVEALETPSSLELYYQPVVDLEADSIVGLEALLRWKHPTRGMIMPDRFIPIAEETGLIVPLGRWVLNEACRQLAIWQSSRPNRKLSMSINVSGRQLEDPGLVRDVAEALQLSGVRPSDIVLEVTESVLMRETELAIRVLHELKTLGVKLAIDDFGTGYSSLGHLQDFPVDMLKVDRCFINALGGGDERASLAEAIVKIGRTLHLQTVAEGIEEQHQADQLRALDCDLGQGFFFARPLDREAIGPLLDRLPTTALTN